MRNPDLSSRTARSAACAASLSYDDALAIVIGHAAPLCAETVPIDHAGGRVLAAPLVARIDLPQRAVAAMDGYAVRSDDLATGRRHFAVHGIAVAGDAQCGSIESGQTRRIMTGAAMPAGGDVVLPWEVVAVDGDTIVVDDPLPQRRHVRAAGCDFARGTELLVAGTRLSPGRLALAAASNHGEVTVRPRPRVGIIASGDELVAPGGVSAVHQCPDSLSSAISQMVLDHGGVIAERLLVGDDRIAITRAACRMIGPSDILVMIGGAARGDRDFSKAGLDPLGLTVAFADIAMKPGKPVWYGRIGTTHVLGLPGNPLAALTTARLFLVPLIAALAGDDPRRAMRWAVARLIAPIDASGGRETFLHAVVAGSGIEIVRDQPASGHLALAIANALVRRPRDAPAAAAGERVCFLAL